MGILLPAKPEPPSPHTLAWAARVWKRFTVVECAGVLWIALRYDARFEPSGTYIDSMSMLPWLGLGEPLQHEIARALERLQTHLER